MLPCSRKILQFYVTKCFQKHKCCTSVLKWDMFTYDYNVTYDRHILCVFLVNNILIPYLCILEYYSILLGKLRQGDEFHGYKVDKVHMCAVCIMCVLLPVCMKYTAQGENRVANIA